ncbi:helix-turn-helix domain-containing protein, partial [Candidatus Symbiopectobacterium sp. NZEC135]|uniref:helix-turn-helix domain-containing protein n=1 Tax=Candidatus Symbiopectobacterium sp. NZEC135 TaxID=2820471 RepID=UPI0022267A43
IRAKLLLQTTQESIANIGRVVGYDDQLYFSRVFRKRVGVSPSDFRRRSSEINYPAAAKTESANWHGQGAQALGV